MSFCNIPFSPWFGNLLLSTSCLKPLFSYTLDFPMTIRKRRWNFTPHTGYSFLRNTEVSWTVVKSPGKVAEIQILGTFYNWSRQNTSKCTLLWHRIGCGMLWSFPVCNFLWFHDHNECETWIYSSADCTPHRTVEEHRTLSKNLCFKIFFPSSLRSLLGRLVHENGHTGSDKRSV